MSDPLRRPRGAVAVIVPRRPSRVGAVDSQLIAAAHLARGFAEGLGGERVALVTEEGPARPEEVLESAVRPASTNAPPRLHHLPTWARVGVGDLQAVRRAVRLRSLMVPDQLRLVVQFHHRFQDVGARLARDHGCPLVLRVEALEVAEQRAWRLRPPRGGRLVEELGERRLLCRADVVSPVSEPLAHALLAAGVDPSRLLMVPNGIDAELFRPGPPVPGDELARQGLQGRFLVGWVGSFRTYHGLAQVDRVVSLLERRLPSATLCLLGDGPQRSGLEVVRDRHPSSLCLLPATRQSEVPAWLATFDVCVQMADPAAGNHYSPLKVLEYLACGRPVVAPDFATTEGSVPPNAALLYPVGDPEALVDAVVRLHDQPRLRSDLAARGRESALARGSWTGAADRMLQAAEARAML